MRKKYSELMEKLEITLEEKSALEALKTIPSYKLSWPRGYENLMKPVGTACAKIAVSKCLEEAKELADSNYENIRSITLQNNWFFSFNMFGAKEEILYSHQMDFDLFFGSPKEPLHRFFNEYITNLFGEPMTGSWRNLAYWNWTDINIEF